MDVCDLAVAHAVPQATELGRAGSERDRCGLAHQLRDGQVRACVTSDRDAAGAFRGDTSLRCDVVTLSRERI